MLETKATSDNGSYVTSAKRLTAELLGLPGALTRDPAQATRAQRIAGSAVLLALLVAAGMAGSR